MYSIYGLPLLNATQQWKADVTSLLGKQGLSLSAFLLLAAVHQVEFDEGHLPNQKEAATVVGLDLNITSQTTKYLVQHHLVNREVSEADSRAYVLSLTLAGEQVLRTALADVVAYEKRFFAKVHPKAFSEALATLTNKDT